MTNISAELIAQKIKLALPSTNASSDGYADVDVTTETKLRCAAVLVPLVWQDAQWHLLFTRRTDKLESHAGQVAFPGGACDDDEVTPEQTALREAQEEIGIRPEDVKILGRLANMITISYFRVTPVVGVIPWPYVFRVENAEVARVFTIPLGWLSQPNHRWQFRSVDGKRNVIVYHPFDGELLWGATARMTVDFLKAIDVI